MEPSSLPLKCACGADLPAAAGQPSTCTVCGRAIGAPPPLPVPETYRTIEETGEISLEQILLDKGWITQDQLKKALDLQAAEARRGQKVRLSQILIHLEAATPVQIRQALLLQGKTPMRCEPCKRNYNIKGLHPGRRALCRVCRAPLISLVTADDLHADDADAGQNQVPVGESIDASIAHLIPGYEIERKLGTGGMGSVYLARQKTLDRVVAIKILKPRLSADADYVARFLKEVRAAGRIRHENIVRAIDAGEIQGRHYLVMEYMEGRTLADVLRTEGALSEFRALDLIRQVAQGLQHAKHQGFVHGDIKPSNILLGTDGITRICDFGLVRETISPPNEERSGIVHATPAYASPEQRRSGPDLDHRSDIYSLGVTLFEMVTGKLPFDARDPHGAPVPSAEEPPSPRTINPAVSESTADLILRMLRKNPEERVSNYRSLLESLQVLMKPIAPQLTEVSLALQPPPAVKKRTPRIAAAITVAAAGAILLALAIKGSGPGEPAPESSPAARLLAEAVRFESAAAGKPEKYPSVLARWKGLVDQHRGTPEVGVFAARYLEFDARRTAEADQSSQALLDQSNLHALARRTLEAIRALDRFPAGFEGTEAASRIASRKSSLEEELDERFEEGKQHIVACAAVENFEGARSHLEALRTAVALPGPDGPRFLKPRHREELASIERSLQEEELVAKRRNGENPQPKSVPKDPEVSTVKPQGSLLPVPAPVKRLDPPDPRNLTRSEKVILDLFKQDYSKTQPSDRQAFARRLLHLAGQTRDDPAGRFILYREAREMAALAGDPTLAFLAIDGLAGDFNVDDLGLKLAVLVKIAQSPMSVQVLKDAAAAHFLLSDEAAAREQADLMEKSAALALQLARRAKDVPLLTRAEGRVREAAEIRLLLEKLQKARENLASSPEDPDSNLVLGRYLCLVREEWTLGLPHLRKGSDLALREIAERDLAGPQSPDEQVSLGDAWWDRAAGEPERTGGALRKRAATWYGLARPQLSGSVKERIEGRMAPARKSETK